MNTAHHKLQHLPKFIFEGSFAIFSQSIGKDGLLELVNNVQNDLIWTFPKELSDSKGNQIDAKDDISCAMLVGSKGSKPGIESNILEIGLLNIASGKTFPQHARDAKEICYILSGSPLLGATEQHVKKVDPGDFVFYDNAAPRVFMVRAENIIFKKK